MPEKISQSLSGVSETLLMTLYARARESQRPDGMIKDDKAVAMVNQIDYDFSRFRMRRHDEIAVIVRMNKFDALARDFLARNPDAAVVHAGCGLDTRFERVAEHNDRVEWFDLDLPGVIALRQKLIPGDNSRHHTLAASILEDGWVAEVSRYMPRPLLFMAEGVLPYFEEAHVKAVFLKLLDHFPGTELVCDALTPFMVWADNLHLAVFRVKARMHWSLKAGKDAENWGEGIRLLGGWYYFEDDDSPLMAFGWIRMIPALAKSSGIFHYRLGTRP
jgi:O-methyltransferase involved in polyketide biosynthesis